MEGTGLKSTSIDSVTSWEALDSRGNPTVACRVALSSGNAGIALVPSGASTGKHEALELRDGGERYGGKGVSSAVANVSGPLSDAVRGADATDQRAVDELLRDADGTRELSKLGANAVLAVSLATAKAAASALGLELFEYVGAGLPPLLPLPMVNIISGGAHAAGAIDIQDLLVVPVGAQSFAEAIEIAWRVRRGTAEAAELRGHNTSLVADEGGLGISAGSNREAIEILAAGIELSGLVLGEDAAIAIDVAATELFEPRSQTYRFATEMRRLSADELIAEMTKWCHAFPIVSIEDVLAEDDWTNWSRAMHMLPPIQLVGDDLFVTNAARLEKGIASGAANAVLIKLNQIGTVTAAREAVELAKRADIATVISARSGETEDAWLADLAVGWRTGQIKVGSTMRSERTAKWNRLLELEARGEAQYAGSAALARSTGTTA